MRQDSRFLKRAKIVSDKNRRRGLSRWGSLSKMRRAEAKQEFQQRNRFEKSLILTCTCIQYKAYIVSDFKKIV